MSKYRCVKSIFKCDTIGVALVVFGYQITNSCSLDEKIIEEFFVYIRGGSIFVE